MPSQFLDLDAFVPPEPKRLRIDGVDYPVLDVLDLTYDDYLELISIEERLAGRSGNEQIGEIRRQIKKLIPACPAKQIDSMSMRKLGWVLGFIRKASETVGSDPLASAAQSN